MSDSNRGYGLAALAAGIAALFVALAVGAYFGSLYGPDHKQYRTISEQERASETYQGQTESLDDIALIPDPIERAIQNPTSYGGKDREERDLAAQESMAVWAFWMAVAALGTMFVTLFGTVLIWRQVSLTRQAVEDTGEATAEMGESNRLMRAEQRAWVKLDVEHRTIKRAPDGNLNAAIKLKMTNVGKSPTVVTGVNVRTFIIGDEDPEPYPKDIEFHPNQQITLFPGDPLEHGVTQYVRIHDLVEVMQRKIIPALGIDIKITYTNAVIGEVNETGTRFLYFSLGQKLMWLTTFREDGETVAEFGAMRSHPHDFYT